MFRWYFKTHTLTSASCTFLLHSHPQESFVQCDLCSQDFSSKHNKKKKEKCFGLFTTPHYNTVLIDWRFAPTSWVGSSSVPSTWTFNRSRCLSCGNILPGSCSEEDLLSGQLQNSSPYITHHEDPGETSAIPSQSSGLLFSWLPAAGRHGGCSHYIYWKRFTLTWTISPPQWESLSLTSQVHLTPWSNLSCWEERRWTRPSSPGSQTICQTDPSLCSWKLAMSERLLSCTGAPQGTFSDDCGGRVHQRWTGRGV